MSTIMKSLFLKYFFHLPNAVEDKIEKALCGMSLAWITIAVFRFLQLCLLDRTFKGLFVLYCLYFHTDIRFFLDLRIKKSAFVKLQSRVMFEI